MAGAALLASQVHVKDRVVNISVIQKSRMIALLLCIFLGIFGAHNFYLGKTKLGIIYFFTFGLLFLGWFKDIFMILFTTVTDSNGVPIG